MSARFDAATDQLRISTGVFDYNAAYSILFWFMIVTDLNAIGTPFVIDSGSGSSNLDWVRLGNDGVRLELRVLNAAVGSSIIGTTLSVGTWYHLALVRESVTSCKLYLDGVLDITHTQDVTGRVASTRMQFGNRATLNDPANCRVAAAIGYPGVALTIDQIKSQMVSMVPKTLNSTYHFWPMFPGATERLRDYGPGARNWTEAGTLTDEAGPPVAWGLYAPPQVVYSTTKFTRPTFKAMWRGMFRKMNLP